MLLTIIFLASLSTSEAQLLFERHQGGPDRYSSAGNFHTASFDVTEAVQVHGIFGWIQGGVHEVEVSITGPHTPDFYRTSFPLRLLEVPPGVLVPPGAWQGVSSLKWNLVPGTYNVNFDQATMPFSYGYNGPVADVPQLYDFMNFNDDEFISLDPFGVRIYGTPLSAIPEPETYTFIAAALLVSAVVYRRVKTRTMTSTKAPAGRMSCTSLRAWMRAARMAGKLPPQLFTPIGTIRRFGRASRRAARAPR